MDPEQQVPEHPAADAGKTADNYNPENVEISAYTNERSGYRKRKNPSELK